MALYRGKERHRAMLGATENKTKFMKFLQISAMHRHMFLPVKYQACCFDPLFIQMEQTILLRVRTPITNKYQHNKTFQHHRIDPRPKVASEQPQCFQLCLLARVRASFPMQLELPITSKATTHRLNRPGWINRRYPCLRLCRTKTNISRGKNSARNDLTNVTS